MSEKCWKCNWINFGNIDKYALLLLLAACLNIATNLIFSETKSFNYPIVYPIIGKIICQLGPCLSFTLFIFYTIRNKRKNFKNYRQLIKANNKNEISWGKKFYGFY